MKTIQLLLGITIFLPAMAALAQNAQEIQLPAGTIEVSTAISSADDSKSFLIHRGAALTSTGNSNIIMADGGSAVTITGNGNKIYVIKSGSATITGDGNEINMMPGAAITDLGKGNRKRAIASLTYRLTDTTPAKIPASAAPAPKAPTPATLEPTGDPPQDPKIAAAAKMIEGLGGGLESLLKLVPIGTDKKLDLSKILTPPADASKPMQGAWEVVSAKTDDLIANGLGVNVTGTLYLLPGAQGIMDASLVLKGTPLPWKGRFTWKEQGDTVSTQGKSDTVLEWKHTKNAAGQEVLSWTSSSSSTVTLTLQRRPATPQ
jgi:hypothetical protein